MTQIAIALDKTDIEANTLLGIKTITGLPLPQIKNNIHDGVPFFNANLFYNDHDDVAQKFLSLIALFEQSKTDFTLYELDEDDDVSVIKDNEDTFMIERDTFINILNSFKPES